MPLELTPIEKQLNAKVEFCGLLNFEQLKAARKATRYPEAFEQHLIGILAAYFTVEEWEELLKRAEHNVCAIKGGK
jgi:hypothetical protein